MGASEHHHWALASRGRSKYNLASSIANMGVARLVGASLLALLMLDLMAGCSDSGQQSNSRAPTETTTRPQIVPITEIERRLGAKLLTPQYIPESVFAEATYYYSTDSQRAEISYYPKKGGEGPLAPSLTLYEDTLNSLPPGPNDNPPGMPAAIAGIPVTIVEVTGTTDVGGATAGLAVYWSEKNLSINALFTWIGNDGRHLVLTDDMRQVAFSVVESMIRQSVSSSQP